MSSLAYRRSRRALRARARTVTAMERQQTRATMQALEAKAMQWETQALQREAALAQALEQAAVWQARAEELGLIAAEARAAEWQSKAEELQLVAAEAQAQAMVWQVRTEALESTVAETHARLEEWQARAQELDGVAAIVQTQARLEKQERQAVEAKAAEDLDRITHALSGERWFSLLFGALVIVWAGVVMLISGAADAAGLGEANTSAWVAIGAGLLLWIEALLRLAIPAYRTRIIERVILGMLLIIVGLGQLTDVNLWPLLLVALGIGALVIGFNVESQRTWDGIRRLT